MIRSAHTVSALAILYVSMSSGQSPTPGKADPSIYPKMRAHALEMRNASLPVDAIYIVLMDWHVGGGTATVLAAADGTASIYLSSGGGFLGGGQRYPELNQAAKRAVQLTAESRSQFEAAQNTDLPPSGQVYFYLITNGGLHRATAYESKLKDGTDPLVALGTAMQEIVTQYRLNSPAKP
jgi:hypothetical protein